MPAAELAQLTATQVDDADDELDVDTHALGEKVSPYLSDADEASSSDDNSGDERLT